MGYPDLIILFCLAVAILIVAYQVFTNRKLRKQYLNQAEDLRKEEEAKVQVIEQLENQEYFYNLITNNSLDIICLLDEHLNIKYVSPSVEEILGYLPSELLNKKVFNFFIPEHIQSDSLKKGEEPDFKTCSYTFQYQVRDRRGKVMWIRTIMKPLTRDDGKTVELLTTSREITEQQNLETLLQETQQTAQVGGWKYFFDTNSFFYTDGIANILDYPDDVTPSLKDIFTLLTSDSAYRQKKAIGRSIQEHFPWDIEVEILNAAGRKIWLRCKGRITFERGLPARLSGTVQNISERKIYENLLFQKQMEMEAFVENTPAAIAMFDPKMRYLSASRQWYLAHSLRPGVLQLKYKPLFPNEDGLIEKMHTECMTSGNRVVNEIRLAGQDGDFAWYHTEMRPWFTKENNLGGTILLTENVTTRKNALEDARKQQMRVEKIYSIASNTEKNAQKQVYEVLKTATDTLGMELGIFSHIVDNTLYILDYYPEGFAVEKWKTYALDETFEYIVLQDNKPVTINDIEVSEYANLQARKFFNFRSFISVPLWVKGDLFGAISFGSKEPKPNGFTQADRDFVQLIGQWAGSAIERGQYENELILARVKAEEASSAKAQFLSVMSHEIRTPMNAIMGLTQLMLEDNPSSDQEEKLRLIEFSAKNLLTLINDILDFSKIESGRMQLEQITFSLPDLLRSLYELYTVRASQNLLKLYLEIDNEVPEFVLGDPVRLNQILGNLLSNALKFTSDGHITLSAFVEDINKKPLIITFNVMDTGIGIPDNKQTMIFEAFSQAMPDTSRKYGGTGLGLSITKKLVEMQGGFIEVMSKQGEGSNFTVTIPFIEMTGPPNEDIEVYQKVTTLDKIEDVMVLVVEDNPVNQFVVKKFLERWQVPNDMAADGKSALEMVRNQKYDIILMDIQMPEMDGYQTSKAIRALNDEHYNHVPILAMTAAAFNEVKEKVFEAGMNDFLGKPFRGEDLRQKIAYHAGPAPKSDEGMTSGEGAKTRPKPTKPRFVRLYEYAGNEMDFYLELLQKMIGSLEEFAYNLPKVVEKNDLDKLGFFRHKIKMSLSLLELNKLEDHLNSLTDLMDSSENSDGLIKKGDMAKQEALQTIYAIKEEKAMLSDVQN
ncbi:MAG: response regulator [Cyclobacteriaceae bacterium]